MKKILVVLDGASDLPIEKFGDRTPFEMAHTPNLDYLTRQGKMGYMYPLGEGVVPGSDNSLITLLGGNSKGIGRGFVEALGLGMKVKKGDLCLRINFGTIDNLKNREVIDRRAGRTLTTREVKKLINELNKKINISYDFEFKAGVQHRAVLVVRGKFSSEIGSNDPEWHVGPKGKMKFEFSSPLDKKELSKKTADVVNEIVRQAFLILNKNPINELRRKKGLLPANMIFVRGANVELPKVKKFRNWMSINSMPLEIGIARMFGMENFAFSYPKMKTIDFYANLYSGLRKSIKFSVKMIKKNHSQFTGCYVQFKATDIPGHDNKPYEKKKMIEMIDKEFFGFLRKFVEGKDIKVVVTCDHSTPCMLKKHSSDPVPVLVYGGERDGTRHFNELEARIGGLGKMIGKSFFGRVGLDK